MAGWVELSSIILPDKGHWQVELQDTTGILDANGNDTGLKYTELVAGGEPWSVLEAKFIELIDADRAKIAADNALKGVVDLVGFEAKLGIGSQPDKGGGPSWST